jgi:Flp pilus assembly protein TadD
MYSNRLRLAWTGYDAVLALARGAMRRDAWSEAEHLLMTAASIAGDDPVFNNLVGVLWEVRGDMRSARRFYGKAIRASSNYAPAQQNMRRLYELCMFGQTRQAAALGDEAELTAQPALAAFPAERCRG